MRLPAIRHVLPVLLLPALPAQSFPGPGGVGRFPSTWNEASDDPRSSLPLGNGEIGLNVWVDRRGDLSFYVGRTDAWGDHGRLLKVGKLRLAIRPPLDPRTAKITQSLELAGGTFRFRRGEGDREVRGRVWVDANHPVVIVELQGERPFGVEARIELWRTRREKLPSLEVSDVLLDRSRPDRMRAPCIVEPDHLVATDLEHAIGWYHFNEKSVGPGLTGEIQGTAGLGRPDPLLHRIFGGLVRARGAERVAPDHLRSKASRTHVFAVHLLTQQPSTPKTWLEALERQAHRVEAIPLAERRRDHEAWWRAFWRRSWIQITARPEARPRRLAPGSKHPLRAGEDQHGHNRFPGAIARASVFQGALSAAEVAELARGEPGDAAAGTRSLLGSWRDPEPGVLPHAPSGDPASFTLEAWIRLDPGPGVGRILDRITPGAADGFLLDTWPGRSLRLLAGAHVLVAKQCLEPGKWHHVAAVVDSSRGMLRLHLDGREVARLEVPGEGFVVSRASALQRYVTACAGRGSFPIKFNGSIFTVPWPGKPGDADYRRWGPGYWWQNTRLPYVSLCTSGDFEMLRPFFAMYTERILPVARYRTKLYFGHTGAFVPECVYFWGDVFSDTYGWTPWSEREDPLQVSRWHKYEWVAGLELVWMMLDLYEHTLDERFLRERILPAARDVLAFFDAHYPRNAEGKLVLRPAQALETWWDCTNPMPEVAGLRAVTERLLALPEGAAPAEDRALWTKVLAETPPLPTREVDGVEMLAPAARFADKRNVENPELYAVFPFRLVAVGRPRLELGVQALRHRLDRGAAGWRQDDVFMAYLGLAQQARRNVVARARNHDRESRFPGFFGPNYDWVPDQDHGAVLMKALQAMLLQSDGRTIHLLPAWPRQWNVDFELRAPYRTVVGGRVEDGELVELRVEPPSRRADVVVHAIR